MPTPTTEGRPASRPYWTFWKTDAPSFWMSWRGIPTFPPETLASPSSFSSVAEAISERTGTSFVPAESSAIGGGCINQANRMTGKDGRNFFVKQNGVDFHDFFEAEARALREIEATSNRRFPVIVFGLTGKSSFWSFPCGGRADSPSSQANSELNWRGFTQSSNPISVGQGQLHRGYPQPNPRSETGFLLCGSSTRSPV